MAPYMASYHVNSHTVHILSWTCTHLLALFISHEFCVKPIKLSNQLGLTNVRFTFHTATELQLPQFCFLIKDLFTDHEVFRQRE